MKARRSGLWAWMVGLIAFVFWYDGRPADDDEMVGRLRDGGLL